MPEYPHLYEVEPVLLEPIRSDRPYNYYGELMVKGSFGNGDSFGEMTITTEYDVNDPYDQRIKSIEAEIMALHQYPDVPHEDYLMLEFEKVVVEAERNIQLELGELSSDETFVQWFCEKMDKIIPVDAPIDDAGIRKAEAKVLAGYIAEVHPSEKREGVVVYLIRELATQQAALESIRGADYPQLLAAANEVIEPILDIVDHRELAAVA